MTHSLGAKTSRLSGRTSFLRPISRPGPAMRSRGWLGTAPAVLIEEDALGYKFSMALAGVEARFVYVIASPRSILIEVRRKSLILQHGKDSCVAECLEQRTTREFRLPREILRGGTLVHLRGGILEITVKKSGGEQDAAWSDLIKV